LTSVQYKDEEEEEKTTIKNLDLIMTTSKDEMRKKIIDILHMCVRKKYFFSSIHWFY